MTTASLTTPLSAALVVVWLILHGLHEVRLGRDGHIYIIRPQIASAP
ncbi:MAG: hypothetical protein ACJ789_05295 [Thermomicrobiales bacterium]